MALGDFILFDDTVDELLKGNLGDLSADDIRLAYISNATTPTADDALPHFGGTGTTDLSTNEQTGGNVAAGGTALATEAVTGNATGAFFDSADVSVAAAAGNPSSVRWGILYNNTLTSKRAIGYLDYGGDVTFVNGMDITVNALGWFDGVTT